jgi:hypothetical protein
LLVEKFILGDKSTAMTTRQIDALASRFLGKTNESAVENLIF